MNSRNTSAAPIPAPRKAYIETVRGRSGGFRLARPAGDISVGDVIRLTEGTLHMVECFNADTNTCPLICVCVLSRKIKEATAAFMAALDGLTTADISANRSALLVRIGPLE